MLHVDPDRRKARNLAGNGRCVVATNTDSLDMVLEGEAVRVRGWGGPNFPHDRATSCRRKRPLNKARSNKARSKGTDALSAVHRRATLH